MVQTYYESMGWDAKTGRPLPQTLKALGLEEVIESF
jgi:aldehyde:ferredoxin oxidoreductase